MSFTDDDDNQETLTSEATEAVKPAPDTSSWSAALTAGSYGDFLGYYSYTRTGELSPNEFTRDGADYTIQGLGNKGTERFELTSNVCLPDGFTVRGRRYQLRVRRRHKAGVEALLRIPLGQPGRRV